MIKCEVVAKDSRVKELKYAKQGDAAVDLYACSIKSASFDGVFPHTINMPLSIYPGESIVIGSGVAILLDSIQSVSDEYIALAGLVMSRSGLSKKGLKLTNSVGLCDQGYSGEILISCKNEGKEVIEISPLERIAQYMVVPVVKPVYTFVEQFSQETERGEGGFGSSGKV